MADRPVYTVRKNWIESSLHPGFVMGDDGTLISDPACGDHYLYLRAVDSGTNDSTWGRLRLSVNQGEQTICYIYLTAMNEDSFYRRGQPTRIQDFLLNPDETNSIKKEFFGRINALRFVNQQDILLYSLKGRYLYMMIEVTGEGDCEISHISVDMQGDNFMAAFPAVYRERDSFFHRFLSIFSSLYNDFEDDIKKLPDMLDPETCPAELLETYASWMGIDVGRDFLDESILRPLVKEAYSLNKKKGTRAALERVAEIVLGEKPLVLERNMLSEYVSPSQLSEFESLYGNSPYDVTILVNEALTQIQKSRLLFLLNQFKPVRARLHIICLKSGGGLDDYAYLDMNAAVSGQDAGSLDRQQTLDSAVQLKE